MGLIIFLGDSITDAGRKTSPNELGFGYVNIFSERLKAQSQNWNILNRGVEGYVVQNVAETLHRECISLKPDYISILVGVNDIGLIANSSASEQDKLYMLEDSIRAYHEMLFDLSRETQAKVIILEPFILPQHEKYEDWVPWQKKMSKNIQKLARNYGAYFIPLQTPLLKLYPQATDVEWEQMAGCYVAEFIADGQEIDVWFNKQAEWVMTETDVESLEKVPAPVAEAFMSSTMTGMRLRDIRIITFPKHPTVIIIEVEQYNSDEEFQLFYAPDGKLLQSLDVTELGGEIYPGLFFND